MLNKSKEKFGLNNKIRSLSTVNIVNKWTIPVYMYYCFLCFKWYCILDKSCTHARTHGRTDARKHNYIYKWSDDYRYITSLSQVGSIKMDMILGKLCAELNFNEHKCFLHCKKEILTLNLVTLIYLTILKTHTRGLNKISALRTCCLI